MIEAGWYDERWELTVYLVLREHRHAANLLLREQGLPALRQWLLKAQGRSRGLTTQWINLVFNPAKEALMASEGGQYESSRV